MTMVIIDVPEGSSGFGDTERQISVDSRFDESRATLARQQKHNTTSDCSARGGKCKNT